METIRKFILDLCGGTGAWAKHYADAGYGVATITLPDHDVRCVEMDHRSLLFEKQNLHYYDDTCILLSDIHGILAAPPCTEFSLAKSNKPRNFKTAMNIVQACLQIIWHCRTFGNLKFWALENPRGLLRQFLGLPAYTFEQWEFGGDKRKATDLWGYFNRPKPTVKQFPLEDYTQKNPCGSSNGRAWGKRKYPPEYAEYISGIRGYTAQRAAARAITPSGFANAFFRANK